MSETYKGVMPFVIMDVIRLALIVFFPLIVFWLPGIR